jgi:hypothetical protein
MRPVTRHAPFIAPTLPRLIRHVEDAGLRLLRWHDTTAAIAATFRTVQAALPPPDAALSPASRHRREWTERVTTAYVATLEGPRGRTGLLIATRR